LAVLAAADRWACQHAAPVPYPERIETERLTVRRLTPADADAYTAIWSDPTVWDILHSEADRSPPEAAHRSLSKQVAHWDEHSFGLWGVLPASEPQPVGWVGAWYPDFVPDVLGEIEIGWTLRAPYRGHGYATEAARLAAAAAFEHLQPERIISMIAPGNDPSAAVAKRLGMRHASDAQTELGLTLRIFELPQPAG
jgi:RimJ/RimL family protein N-acetyltransferase